MPTFLRTGRAVLLAVAASVSLVGCRAVSDEEPTIGLDDLPPVPDTPPAWMATAVWYEIDVDRFRNGDPDNDPTPAAVAEADAVSAVALLDAGWQPMLWASDWAVRASWETPIGPPDMTVPLRRYGGDLKGVLDMLPEIEGLGVTALLMHVADPSAPHHVDPHIGRKPERDREAVGLETPGEPETWGTSIADGLLLDLVEAAHQRGLRVVLDVNWPASLTTDRAEENALAIAARWLDPDGDGDPADGVDGFRLGAEAGSPAFRADLRRVVKTLQPEAALLGRGTAASVGAFDALTDDRVFGVLQRLLDPLGPQLSPAAAAVELGDLYARMAPDHLPAFVMAEGDAEAPRLATALRQASAPDSVLLRPGDGASRPGAEVVRSVELYRLLQATLPGAPHVRAGDEVGVWGGRAPDNRRPMPWDDLVAGTPQAPDTGLRALTSEALGLRRAHADLFATGTLTWASEGDVLRFARQAEGVEAVIVVNLGALPVRVPADATALAFHVGVPPGAVGDEVVLAPRSGAVFVKRRG